MTEVEDPAPVADPSLTREVLALVREVRLERTRRQRRRKVAYAAYVAVLLTLIYAWPFVDAAVRAIGEPRVSEATSQAVLRGLPAGLAALLILVILTVARDATWRGPVVLSAPDAEWLLPLPLDRALLLRPRFVAAVVVGGALGALAGAVLALALHAAGLGGLAWLAAAGMPVGALSGVLAVSLATLVERWDGWARRLLAWSAPVVAGVALCGLLAVADVHGARVPWADAVVLWSGPWGWAAQPVVAVAGGHVPGWPLAAGLLALAAAAAGVAAHRAATAIPAAALRARASAVSGVRAALFLGETRDARGFIRAARGQGPRVRSRVRPPRRRSLALPWRDAVALSRVPMRVAWSAGYVAVAAALAFAAFGRGSVYALAAAVVAGYLAAAQLVEAARLDAEDPRRASFLPYGLSSLAVRHVVLPSAVLAALGWLACLASLPWMGPGALPLGLVLVAAAAPVATAAALASSYRGEVPLYRLFLDPSGTAGPLMLLQWYLAGPLATLAALFPLGLAVLASNARPAALAGLAVARCAAACGLLLAWAARRAGKIESG